jgi:hypothetical protein
MFNGNMIIKDILQLYPKAEKVFTKHGIKVKDSEEDIFKSIDHVSMRDKIDRDSVIRDLNKEV